MNWKLRLLAIGFLYAGLLGIGCGRPGAAPEPPARSAGSLDPADVEAELKQAIPGLLGDARIPGLSVCLIREDRLAWCEGFGITSSDDRKPVTTTTVFQAASLSKPVFAYAVLQLVDEGVIDLDTPLVEYVGEEHARADHLGEDFTDARIRDVTARMVLSHTSGFPNWRREEKLRFLFDPGARWSYSGEGFGLLQSVVQRLTGNGLEDLARTRVFEPLGMEHSTFDPAKLDPATYAWAHDWLGKVDGGLEDLRRRIEEHPPHAAASLLTTAPDYGRFLVAVMTGLGLEDRTHADCLTPQVDVDDEGSIAWGLGVGLERGSSGTMAWHWGDNFNSKAFFMADPERGDAIVYFANSFNGLSVVRDLVGPSMPGQHPVLASKILAEYPPHDSPGFRFALAVREAGPEPAVALVRELQARGSSRPIPEEQVNQLGYWLLGQDRIDDAIVLFELNVEMYPEAWNVYDSLGEALLEEGRSEEGFAAYRRSLELNPNNDHASTVLREAGQR